MSAAALSFANLYELETLARDCLPAATFDYFAGGANDEITLRENSRAYDLLELHYRVMVDVSRRDTSLEILGRRFPSPVLVAPMAFQRLAHEDGELATARAAAATGSGMVLSTFSTTPSADVRAATASPLWFQLYLYKDRGASRALVESVEAAGFDALVLTVDGPVIGRRERDVRNRFQPPADIPVPNAMRDARESAAAMAEGSGLAAYISSQIDLALTWPDIEWLRSVTRLPILVKGVARADDAELAVGHGAAGVIVSNHGGRQLDTAPATITLLPAIAEAVGGNAEVLVDGGIRRGTDVVKALALGARGVLLGRPVLWGLALGGQHGVEAVLRMLEAELSMAMALCGCPNLDSITPDLVRARGCSC
jgi:4-hydroxymandelate oxidase